MGESSAPRRPTHDTNTSRREVNTQTHTYQQQQQQQHFIKYKHIMKIAGLIASTLMLLLAVMASTASARGMDRPCYSGDLMIKHGKIHENKCCWAGRFLSGDRVAKCQNKPSNPNDCFAPRQKKEIKHGEQTPTFCCWYGQWLHKDTCESTKAKVSHPDNCYHPRSKKEIMHGEIGPLGKACCWYGKWANKSNCDSAVVG